jgi:hypothetical protein
MIKPSTFKDMTTDDLLERVENAVTASCILGVTGGLTLGFSLVELRISPSIMNIAGGISGLVLLAFLYWGHWLNKKFVIPELQKRFHKDS